MSLLTQNDINSFTGIFAQHFPTFANFRPVKINKEPLKTFTNIVNAGYGGYEETSNLQNVTYTPVYANYSGIVTYPEQNIDPVLTDTNLRIPFGGVRIKFEQNAHDYISNGKTESVEIDGLLYSNVSSIGVQNYLGLKYYIYHVGRS